MTNAENPFQGKFRKVLTVCSAGLLRSPTAAAVLNLEYDYNTRACGHSVEFALIPIDEVLIWWADEIVYMTQHIYDAVHEKYHDDEGFKKADHIILHIEDKYEYGNEELELAILKQYGDAMDIKRYQTKELTNNES
jgi:predicted protein tyrosine phosphatase